jgi:TonB family protein
VSKYDGNWHGWLLQAFDGGNFMFQIERTTNVQKAASGSLGQIAPNTWVHVAGTYDGTNVRLYLNGSVVGAVTFDGGYTPTTTPMTIGKASWFDRDFVSGKIDEVEFFSRALTAAEIVTLAGIGSQGQCQAPSNSDPLTADPVLFPSDGRKPESGDTKGNASNDPAGEKVFAGKDVDQRAQILSRPAPSYTEEGRKNLISGTVVLSAVLAANGRVTQIRVIKGLPNGLTEQAIAAARKVKFTPAMKDGQPVSQAIQFEYNFSPY